MNTDSGEQIRAHTLSLYATLGIYGTEEDTEDELLGLPVVSTLPLLFLKVLGRCTL